MGKKVKEEESELAKAVEKNQICGGKNVPILFEEADGVYINIQGQDHPKSGKKLEMKVAVAYVGFEDVSEFYKRKEVMIAKEYNTDEIETRILNGDGAAWIKHGIDDTVHY